MRIGVPKEQLPGETRVAATPDSVVALTKLGYEVAVETGAGARSTYGDSVYVEAGATIVDHSAALGSDVVLAVNVPTGADRDLLNAGGVLICLIAPAQHADLVADLAQRGLTVLATDAVPRVSRAQAFDVLSSMANTAGYRAVIESAQAYGGFFGGQITAAGKVPPAKVLVAGAGVAGLAAIGAAKNLGAIVYATDARPEVAEQVRSMGGQYLAVTVGQQGVSADGYAKETSEDFNKAAAELYAKHLPECDIVITTALIPGRPAPRLITADMVASMKPGSVIVDMAAANGGNVEGTVADQLTVTENGVKLIGYTDLAGRLPKQASRLYGTNLSNLLKLLTPAGDGQIVIDLDDAVVRGMTVAKDHNVLWPPPPVQVSSAAKAAATSAVPVVDPAAAAAAEEAAKKSRRNKMFAALAIGALALFGIAQSSPPDFLGHFMVFMLACVVGYYVIGNVHHALHTPLMSVTNAISGIIVVGALLQIGSKQDVVAVLAFLSTLIVSINIFGGFTVTQRMLAMFKRG